MPAAYVYRVFDTDARLIYVGCTVHLATRLEQHTTDSWWAFQAVKVRAVVHPTVALARAAELAAIKTEHPRWNIHGLPPRASWSQQQYIDYVTAHSNRVDIPAYKTTPRRMERVAREYAVRFGTPLPRLIQQAA